MYRSWHRFLSPPIRPRPYPSIPQILLIAFNSVLCEEIQILLFKGLLAVVFILPVDVVENHCQFSMVDRERSVTALPSEVTESRRLGFDPFCGVCFQFLYEVGDGDRSGEANGEMDVIGHASGPVAFASVGPCHLGEVSVDVGAEIRCQVWCAVFGAEDDVDDDGAEGLWQESLRLGFRDRTSVEWIWNEDVVEPEEFVAVCCTLAGRKVRGDCPHDICRPSGAGFVGGISPGFHPGLV